MYATRVLIAQHRAIDALFAEVDHETRRPARARAVSQLAEELIAHMAAEEAVFYPVAQRVLRRGRRGPQDGSRGWAGEHIDVRVHLRRLLGASLGDAVFRDAFARLRATFERHAQGEESALFPRVERALGEAELDRLGTEVLASRPPIWMVTAEPRQQSRTRRKWPLRSRVSLPIPPARG
jgi:hemerythrin superfamily protein